MVTSLKKPPSEKQEAGTSCRSTEVSFDFAVSSRRRGRFDVPRFIWRLEISEAADLTFQRLKCRGPRSGQLLMQGGRTATIPEKGSTRVEGGQNDVKHFPSMDVIFAHDLRGR